MLGFTGTLGSLLEFLVCPAMGRLSDSYGRRKLIIGNLTVSVHRHLHFAQRSPMPTSSVRKVTLRLFSRE